MGRGNICPGHDAKHRVVLPIGKDDAESIAKICIEEEREISQHEYGRILHSPYMTLFNTGAHVGRLLKLFGRVEGHLETEAETMVDYLLRGLHQGMEERWEVVDEPFDKDGLRVNGRVEECETQVNFPTWHPPERHYASDYTDDGDTEEQ